MNEAQVLTGDELYLFHEGTLARGYRKLGAHLTTENGVDGVCFTVWAPGVSSVSVAGEWSGWRGGEHRMSQDGGIWTCFVPGIREGALYKYIITAPDGREFFKADPCAFAAELRPGTASQVADLSRHAWRDEGWMRGRASSSRFDRPMNVYEVHLGSWRQRGEKPSRAEETPASEFYTYRELAELLVPYVKDMGYTHLELLPVMEHPYDGSWGYQVTGFFAPTSRYGTPEDLMVFVDACHGAGLGVILDWVPGHFCRDEHGLGRFTGDKLYEGDDHAQWGTYKFDFGRPEVRSFLLTNALFWLDIYHIDGLRVDGVSSMLYLNFGVEDKRKHRKNALGGDTDLDAAAFLRLLNKTIGTFYPDVFTAAEESTAWPLVTYPPDSGGLGFHYKWDMGWMNDTLRYLSLDFPARPAHHKLLTFSMMYAFSENFTLPLSHDEVVHGKRSLIGRMPGDTWRQFAGLRLLMLYQMCHPGSKLSFMGNEFAQFIEWRYYEGLEWFLLGYETHGRHRSYIAALNRLYLLEKPLWEQDRDWRGFSWLDADNTAQSVMIFRRQGRAERDFVLVVLNFSPAAYDGFQIGAPYPGEYTELMSSDETRFGGSGRTNPGVLTARTGRTHGQDYTLEITVPPLGGTIIKPRQI
jgi:1,4-alpha-glucan branching enzyme